MSLQPFKPSNWDDYHERLAILVLAQVKSRFSKLVTHAQATGRISGLAKDVSGKAAHRFEAGLQKQSPLHSWNYMRLFASYIVQEAMGMTARGRLMDKAAWALHKQRNLLDVKLQGPRPKAKQIVRRARRPKLPAVARRAVEAQDKLTQWKRKQKLAATKVKMYQKKVNYYNKKGV